MPKRLPQVIECRRITGDDCFLLKVHAATVGKLEVALDQFPSYGQTSTPLVVSTPGPMRPLPVGVNPGGEASP